MSSTVPAKRRQVLPSVLATYRALGNTVLDSSIDNHDLRRVLFKQMDPKRLARQMDAVGRQLTGKHSHVLNAELSQLRSAAT